MWYAPRYEDSWVTVWDGGHVAYLEETGSIFDYNMVFVSHDTGPLKDIPQLKRQAIIYVYTNEYEVLYYVTKSSIVYWQELWPVMPTDHPVLTLIICYGNNYRYVVQADQLYRKKL